MARNFWDPGAGLQGLFDVWSFRHVESVVASGLGGGSLIYANVMLRKDERWFTRDQGPEGGYESWPAFLADPGHVAEVSGSVRCAAFGGRLPLRSGTLRLLTDAACPGVTSRAAGQR